MKRLFLLSIGLCIFAMLAHAQSYEIRRAQSLIGEKKYTEAARLLRPLADGGDAEAQFLAASLFFDGHGVVKSEAQGMKYLTMAVKQYHIGATHNYLLKIKDKTNRDTKMEIIEDCLKNNPDASNSILAYDYYVLNDDKESGWKLLADSKTKKEGYYMMDKETVIYVLTQEHENFYRYLIDKYIDSPKTLKHKLEVEYLHSASRDLGFQWAHESMGYLYEKIKTCDYQVQRQHLNTWSNVLFSLFKTIRACMEYEGIGTNPSLYLARKYAMDVKTCGNIEFPWVKKNIDIILNTYVSGLEVDEGDITINSVKGDSVWVTENNKAKMYLATDLTDHIIALRQKAIDFEIQKSQVKVISTRQGIIVDPYPHVEPRYDELNLMFIVKTNTPNSVRFEVTSAGCTNETIYDEVTYEVIGRETKSGLNLIPPHKQIYVKVKISGVPKTGKFKQLAVGYSSDYGSGYFLVNNLVW